MTGKGKSDQRAALLVIHWGRTGGGPRFTVRMAEELFALWPGDVYASLHTQAVADNRPRLPVENISQVTTYRRHLGVLNILRLARNILRTRRLIREKRVGYVYSGMISVWQSLAVRLIVPRRVAYIASIHDPHEHPGEESLILRLCKREELRRASAVVTYTDAAAVLVRAQLGARETPVISVTHGADAPTRTVPRVPPPRGRDVRIGFVGRIVEYKGIDLFVDMIIELRRRELQVKGIVSGDGDVAPELVTRAGSAVDWHIGWIEEAALPALLESIDILCLPYREASQSGVFTLGIAAGVPVVATPMEGLKEQVGVAGAGIIADRASAPALADSVEKLMGEELYVSQSAAGIAAAAGILSWRESARSLVAQYLAIEQSWAERG